MITFAKPREGEAPWADQDLRSLDNEPLSFAPENEWVKVVCFDGASTGLYVLTDDDDNYFTCHSIVLEFKNTVETANEMRLTFDRESQETTYTATTPFGKIDFFYANSMYEAYLEAKATYGDYVTIRPSWYGEWDCGSEELATEKGNGCWYDQYGNHHKMKDGVVVS